MAVKFKSKLKKLSKKDNFTHGRFSRANLTVFAIIFAAIGGYFIYSSFAATSCSQTFTPSTIGSSPYPGSAVNTAVKNASAGTTLCFASGSYGEIDIYGARPSGTVTLTRASGAAASLGWLNLNGVSNLTVTGFTGSSSSGGLVLQYAGQGSNDHFTYSNNRVTSAGVVVRDNPIANANIKIDNNTFANWDPLDRTARIKASNMSGCPNGVTISNNLIDGGSGDGIETGGNSCGTQIVNNEISNIIQANCVVNGNHCDAFQDLGGGINTVVSGNYFHDDSDCFLLDDGSTNVTISNNLCTKPQNSSYWLQFGGASGITFDHNTIAASSGGSYGNDHNNNPSSNVKFTNNIIYQMPINNPGQPVGGTFTNDYNICQGGCGSGGSHNISGTPTYVGGSSPSTVSGFALTTSSLGHNAASDGTDMGANLATVGISGGSVTPPPPPPPTDTTPPTVSLTAPNTGATVSGSTVTVSANASDNVGVTGVQFKLDGSNLGSEDTSSPYSITWDSTLATNGSHTLTAVAKDAAGNTATATNITVTVNNATSCKQSTTTWQNTSFTAQTSSFTFDIDATPLASGINSVVGLSSGAASAYTNLAAVVRFNSSGFIDAASGSASGVYTSDVSVPYTANTSYHFKLTVNPTAHSYSVVVSPAGGSAINLATNYPFRSEQATLSTFNNWALFQDPASVGSQKVCGATINTSGGSSTVGDINLDGKVDIFDLSIMLSKYNTSTANCDLNSDNTVNIFDLSILLSHYGS